MKKTITLILALALTSLLSITAFGATAPWDGTVDTTWYNHAVVTAGSTVTIDTAEQLAGLAKLVDDGTTNFEGVTIKLGADIDLNSKNWEPIGAYAEPYDMNKVFKGTFDGQNHKIENLKIDTNTDFLALFSINYGIIKNLTIASGDIKGAGYIGGIAVLNHGTIKNCTNKANITARDGYSGGIVAYNYGTIRGCSNEGTVTGETYIGGIAHGNFGKIIDSNNKGTVTAIDNSAGGVVSDNYINGLIINCYNTGTIEGNFYVGGIAGTNWSRAKIQNCYNTGAIEGNFYVGGIVGYSRDNTTIQNCYNTGAIKGNNSVGGIVGYSNSSSIQNCYNIGIVTSINYYAGGIVGSGKGSSNLQACYSTGAITSPGYKGGVAGEIIDDATAKYVYYLTGTATKAIGDNYNTSNVTDVKAYTTNADLAQWLTSGNTALGITPPITWSVDESGNIVTDIIIGIDPDKNPPDDDEEIPPTKTNDNSPPSFAELEYQYFTAFISKIRTAKAGDIIDIDAKYYTSMPASVIDTLYGKDITIRLKKDGKTADISGLKVSAPSKNRAYYPIEYLMGLAK